MRRPGRDVDPWEGPAFVMLGAAHGIGEAKPRVLAELLVPDPTVRGGWAIWNVTEPEPERRPIGFRPPSEREA